MRGIVISLALVAALCGSAGAHGMRSAYVEITQVQPDRARISIRGKVPVAGIEVVATKPCTITTSETGSWLSCPAGIAGAMIEIAGMGPVVSEAVVYITLLDGHETSAVVTPGSPTWVIPGGEAPSARTALGRYLALGLVHIATGADHLLFLLGLVLCLRNVRAVMLAETAFTLSHTLSFTASALGWVHVSAAAAEAGIAASLILVALDIGRSERVVPWHTAALAFLFGLVHGLGFAGGVSELGLPDTQIPAALAGFACGVELGQVAFLAIVLSVFWLARRVPGFTRGATYVGAYGIGGIGWFWLFERLGALR
ncbi:MAG: HupE/UreJ family protein [Kofleriaceae bacterium]